MSQKTKHKLASILKEQLSKETSEKITIGDLADGCGINRKTFYYHFHDIYDLLRWTVEADVTEAWGENHTYESWHDGYLSLLTRAAEDDTFIISAFPHLDADYLARCMYTPLRSILTTALQEETAHMDLDAEDNEHIIDFLCHAVIGTTMDWIRDGMKKEPEYLAGVVSDILYSALPGILEALRLDKPRRRRVYPVIK